MPLSPRLPQPERPDPAQRLLAAVAEGDGPTARRLGERLVHRLGVEAFVRWQRERLEPVQGTEAVQWLCAQLQLALPAVEMASDRLPASPFPAAPLTTPPLPSASLPANALEAAPGLGLEGAGGPAPGLRALPRPASLQDAAPAPATVRRLRAWLRDLPQAS